MRFCWSLARLGCRDDKVIEAFEVVLSDVLDRLQYKELEATQGVESGFSDS